MNEKDINILIVEPGKAPRPATMANTLNAAEQIVGGSLQIGCFLPQRVLLISREDTTGLTPNRPLRTGKATSAGHSCCAGCRRRAATLRPFPRSGKRNFRTNLRTQGNL